MEIVLGFVGVLVGAGVAVIGQLMVRRREEHERWLGVLLDECARIYVLEDDFTGAIWEAHGEPKNPSRLSDWPRSDRRASEARLRIVCTDETLLEKVDQLRLHGRAIWQAADEGKPEEEWRLMIREHRKLLEEFVGLARSAARGARTV